MLKNDLIAYLDQYEDGDDINLDVVAADFEEDTPADQDGPAIAAGPFLTILTIQQKHETTASIHRTPEGAEAELARYVRKYWREVSGYGGAPVDAPQDDDEAIDIYFETHDEESYTLIGGLHITD